MTTLLIHTVWIVHATSNLKQHIWSNESARSEVGLERFELVPAGAGRERPHIRARTLLELARVAMPLVARIGGNVQRLLVHDLRSEQNQDLVAHLRH